MKQQAHTSIASDALNTDDLDMEKSYEKALEYLLAAERDMEDTNIFERKCGFMEKKSEAAEVICKLAAKGYKPAQTFSKAQLESSAKIFNAEEALIKPYMQVKLDCEAIFLKSYESAIWGYAPAQNRLGAIYRIGSVCEENEDKAAEWFKKASEQGNMSACKNLGDMYSKGFSNQKVDRKKAIELFRKALKSKDQEESYRSGEGLFLLAQQLYLDGRPKSEYMPLFHKSNTKGYVQASAYLTLIETEELINITLPKLKTTNPKKYRIAFNKITDPKEQDLILGVRSDSDSDSDEALESKSSINMVKYQKKFRETANAEKIKRENEIKKKQEEKAQKKAIALEKIIKQNLKYTEDSKKEAEERRQILALEDKKKKEQEIEENSILSFKMLQNMLDSLGCCLEDLKKLAPKLKSECAEVVMLVKEGVRHLHNISQYRFLHLLQGLEAQTDSLLALSIKESGKTLCKNIENGIKLCNKLQRKNGKPEKLTQDESIILKGIDTNDVMEALWGIMDDVKKTHVLQEAAKSLNDHKLLIIHKYHMLLEKFRLLKEFYAELDRKSTTIQGSKASTKHVVTTDQKNKINTIVSRINSKITQFETGKSESASVKLVIEQEEVNNPVIIASISIVERKVQAEEANFSKNSTESSVEPQAVLVDPEDNVVEVPQQTASHSASSVDSTSSGSESEDESMDELPVARKQKNDSTTRLIKFLDKKKLKEAEKQKKTAEMLQQYHEDKTIKELIAAKGAGRPENLIFSRQGLGNNTKKVSPQSPEARSYTDHLEQFGEIIKNLTVLKKGSSLEIEDTYALLESFAEVSELVKYGTKDRDIIKVANHIRNALYKRHEMVLEMIEGTPGCLLDMAQSWFDFLNTEQVYYFKNEEAVLKQINVRLTEVYALGNSLKKWHIDENGNKYLVKQYVYVKKHLHTVLNVSTYLATRPQESKDVSENTTAGKAGDASDKKFMALKFCCAVLQDAIKQLSHASKKKITGGKEAYTLALNIVGSYYSLIENLGVLARHPITLLQELEKMPSLLVDELLFNNPLGSKEHSPTKPVIIYYKPKGKSFPTSQQLETTEEGQRVITELERMMCALNELNENSAAIINDAKDRVLEEIVLSKQIFTPEDIKKMFHTIWEISFRATAINTKCLGSSTNIGYHALVQVTECSQAVSNILPKDQVTPCLMKM